ncbi:acyltransferase family protein [Brachybacterium alimentarium]|uniref:acyltransferase family protein n=1 Tax=Brachybacterium alimentarium TaxID=47845 RepID=UPI000DF2BE64|nr:acyltransferase family protein [Brachybacterium alimentarium]RCS75347.1 acyltransferase [Brachybacterium alimentarium]
MPSTPHQRRQPHRPHRSGSSSPAAGPAGTTDGATGGTAAGRFRPELHGLRGLAIALVVLYHVWFDRVSGGVDVFLFLSSFLLVGTFLRRVDRGQGTRPLAYWGRTFKRLLPPTAVVSLATLGGVYLILPADRWMPAITDAIGSLLHVENWVLIRRGVDYYAAAETGPSAFQHFWSLSIQGQVFLLWPLLIAVGVLVARVLRRSPRVVLGVVFALVLVASFVWSVHSTSTQQEIAYFDTFTRLWEFAAGSLLGLLLPFWEERAVARRSGRRRSVPRAASPLRVLAGWAGIVGLVSCGLLIDVQGAFPGWIAAWPLTAAAVVLLVGTTGHRLSVDRILSTGPAKVLGEISYGLYLVHWPLLTLYLAHTGKDRAGVLDGLLLILASLAAAWLLTRVVDTPLRRWPWASAKAWRSGAVALTCLVLGLTPALAAQQYLLTQQQEAEARAVADNPGARVLDPDFTPHPDADPDAEPLPTSALLGADWVSGEQPCTGDLAPEGSEKTRLDDICRVVPGREGAPVIVSVGNSRLEQFSASLIALAQKEGWTLVTLWKGGCAYTPDAEIGVPACDGFSADAESYLSRVSYDAIALNTTFMDREGQEVIMPGMEQTLPDLAADARVIAVRDLPRMPFDQPVCTQEKGLEDPECAPPLAEPLTQERPDAQLLAATDGEVAALEVNDLVCPDGTCTPVIGNVVVSLDDDHLTGTYAESLQDAVGARLRDGGFRW